MIAVYIVLVGHINRTRSDILKHTTHVCKNSQTGIGRMCTPMCKVIFLTAIRVIGMCADTRRNQRLITFMPQSPQETNLTRHTGICITQCDHMVFGYTQMGQRLAALMPARFCHFRTLIVTIGQKNNIGMLGLLTNDLIRTQNLIVLMRCKNYNILLHILQHLSCLIVPPLYPCPVHVRKSIFVSCNPPK